MLRFWVLGLLLSIPAMAAGEAACGGSSPELDGVFDHLYNFNFPATHASLDRFIKEHPREPIGYAIRASAYLFYELDRLGILESEFLTSDKRIAAKKAVRPDPEVRTRVAYDIAFLAAVGLKLLPW